MEINIVEESKNRLVVEIKGEGHSLCNALKQELWNNKKVKVSGYNIEHPLVGVPKLIIETSAGSPKDALVEAANAVKKDADAFLKSFSKAVK
ncbi:DNA-directed RNA polymerase subunit L [Candidatus Woesearchaeota archaeon]|nr:DNA-directed RNA polymerase subunit L [Candidatus Woesearchaeota archaeon]